jgi:hypothetical protein
MVGGFSNKKLNFYRIRKNRGHRRPGEARYFPELIHTTSFQKVFNKIIYILSLGLFHPTEK